MCDSYTNRYLSSCYFIAYPLPTHSHYLQALLNAGVFPKLSMLISSTSDSLTKVLTLYLSFYNIIHISSLQSLSFRLLGMLTLDFHKTEDTVADGPEAILISSALV